MRRNPTSLTLTSMEDWGVPRASRMGPTKRLRAVLLEMGQRGTWAGPVARLIMEGWVDSADSTVLLAATEDGREGAAVVVVPVDTD